VSDADNFRDANAPAVKKEMPPLNKE
jgi:hypothetical protein